MKKNKVKIAFSFLIFILLFTYHNDIRNFITASFQVKESAYQSYEISKIPEYQGQDYVILSNNIPTFDESFLTSNSFESYHELDFLGRSGVAFANLGLDLMPTEKRGSIGMIKPSGWNQAKYDFIDGKYLYNRCHLIGYQLSGENANEKNLITCTRQLNTGAMLEVENMIASYIKKTGNHVLYRVTPIFKNDDLLAYGVQVEAYSVEDYGKGIKFNWFLYNVQDGVVIDYKTGKSELKH